MLLIFTWKAWKAIKSNTLKNVIKKLKEPLSKEKSTKKDTPVKVGSAQKTSTKADVKQTKNHIPKSCKFQFNSKIKFWRYQKINFGRCQQGR